MHINNKTICWSIQGNNCYYNASPQTTEIIQVIVWFGIYFLSLPLNLSWFSDLPSCSSFLLTLSRRSCWPFVSWLSCGFHFLSLHHEMPRTGTSPPPDVQRHPVFLVFLFSFFSFFSELQGYSCNQLDRSYQDLSFAMTRASLAAPGCQVQGPTVNR